MEKSQQRIAAEKAASASGRSLVYVNWFAHQMVSAGMFSSQVEALEYIAANAGELVAWFNNNQPV